MKRTAGSLDAAEIRAQDQNVQRRRARGMEEPTSRQLCAASQFGGPARLASKVVCDRPLFTDEGDEACQCCLLRVRFVCGCGWSTLSDDGCIGH